MESLIVRTENAAQLKTVKAVLKALKVQFEPKPEPLPPHVLKGIKESLAQYEKDGKSISFEEFKEKHLLKK